MNTVGRSRPDVLLLKAVILSFFLLCPAHTMIAATPSVEIGGTAVIGAGYGSTHELVLQDQRTVSDLAWDQHWSPKIGLDMDMRIWNFFLEGRYTGAVPTRCGYLQDYDYLLPDSDAISLYSKHDAYLDKDMSASARLGYMVRLQHNYQLVPFIGYTYRNRKWTAQDGYLQYPTDPSTPWTGDEPKRNVKGTGISYEQSIHILSIGMENIILWDSRFIFGAVLEFYPIVCVDSLDSHFLRSKQFYDEMRTGFGGKASGWMILTPFSDDKDIGFKFTVAYEAFMSRGTTSSNSIGVTDSPFIKTPSATSKTTSSNLSFTIGVTINPGLWD